MEEAESELEVAEINQVIKVSLNSDVGLTCPHIMKLRGGIRKREVVTLIDPLIISSQWT